MDLALRMFGKARIMSDHADGGAVPVQVLQQFHDGFAAARIQISSGLVREQDGGMSGEGAGHSYALLLTTGELRRIVTHAVRHADPFERFHHPRLAIGRRHLCRQVKGSSTFSYTVRSPIRLKL